VAEGGVGEVVGLGAQQPPAMAMQGLTSPLGMQSKPQHDWPSGQQSSIGSVGKVEGGGDGGLVDGGGFGAAVGGGVDGRGFGAAVGGGVDGRGFGAAVGGGVDGGGVGEAVGVGVDGGGVGEAVGVGVDGEVAGGVGEDAMGSTPLQQPTFVHFTSVLSSTVMQLLPQHTGVFSLQQASGVRGGPLLRVLALDFVWPSGDSEVEDLVPALSLLFPWADAWAFLVLSLVVVR
jgi:hypothetical protein